MPQLLKIIMTYLAVFISFFIAGNPNSLTATVNEPVTTETEAVTVTLKNETGKIVSQTSTRVHSLEQKINGEWVTVGITGVPEDSILFLPTQEYTETVSFSGYGHERLSVGEYRLVIPHSVKTKDIVQTTAYAYFTVVE